MQCDALRENGPFLQRDAGCGSARQKSPGSWKEVPWPLSFAFCLLPFALCLWLMAYGSAFQAGAEAARVRNGGGKVGTCVVKVLRVLRVLGVLGVLGVLVVLVAALTSQTRYR